jgi:tetratricopeptide (TPR) repeat protein
MCSFSRIYWVDGTSRETMEASIVSIASDEDAKAAGVDASSQSVLRWMGRRDDNWLMIFDGADVGYEIVERFIPPGKHGNILISTRNATMKRLASPSSAYMDVIELDETAAIELFTRAALLDDVSPVQRVHVEAIVRELCCLALAVDQAASSIATGICYIDEYLAMYNQRRRELMDDELFKGSSNYGRAVYTTWDISFTELERRASSSSSDSVSYKVAIFLLRVFSFFHFDGIHEDIFRRAAEATDHDLGPLSPDSPLLLLVQQTADNGWDSFAFRAGVRILSQFSLIKMDGKSTRMYSMHRLIHQWMQDRLPMSSRSEMALLATIILARSANRGNRAEDHAHRRVLLVHLISVTPHLTHAGLMNQLSVNTIVRMTGVYRQGGKPAYAEELLRQAISLLHKDTPEPTKQHIELLSQLASVLRDLGKLREAVAFGREVLEWREKHLGTNHVSIAATKFSLATALDKLGELGEAKELKIQVLDWHKKHLGMDHPSTYQAMANLAATFHGLGELGEAKELEIQVLDWQKKHLGMDHPDTYLAMANLAATFRGLGEFGEAKELQIQVLDWRKEHLGMDHPDTYRAMANLACTLVALDELSEAKGLEVQVLDWRKVHLRPKHRLTILAMENLADTLTRLGEIGEAERLTAQVTELRSTPESLRTAGTNT